MNTYTVHAITDGALVTHGWSVLKNGIETVKEFLCPREACLYVSDLKRQETQKKLESAIKSSKKFNLSLIQVVMADTKCSEFEAMYAANASNWEYQKTLDWLFANRDFHI